MNNDTKPKSKLPMSFWEAYIEICLRQWLEKKVNDGAVSTVTKNETENGNSKWKEAKMLWKCLLNDGHQNGHRR